MGEFNDLIFKELIKRGYSLEGKTRVWNIADSKLWYLTPAQAQSFLDLEKSEEYQKEVIQKEIDLIKESLGDLLKKVNKKPINIMDLGCGDGKKAVIFIGYLKGKVKLRYCPIDISDYMISKAIDKIRRLNVGEVVEFQWNVSDFENLENVSHLLRMGEFKNNLFLLLGNTLGNFEINELMYEIWSSMGRGDILLIGNGLDNRNHEEILRTYNNSEVHDFLIKILTQIGFSEQDLEFGTRFKNSRVEEYYTVLTDKVISFQDKKIQFNKGDQIVVAISYKYGKDDFNKYLNIYFDDFKLYTDKDNSYGLAICKK